MEAKSKNGSSPERSPQAAKDSQFSKPDELIRFAQQYFSSDFPNAERVGCPTTGTLYGLVRLGNVPDELLRAHMFGCSECFREYRVAVRARNEHPTHVSASSWSIWLAAMFKRPSAPIYASAIALILLSLLSLYIWRGRDGEHASTIARTDSSTNKATTQNISVGAHTRPPSPAVSPSPPSPAEQSSPVAPPQPAVAANPVKRRMRPASPPRPDESDQGELLAMNTGTVDLEEFTALRGTEESARVRQSIRLTSPRTHLKLKFPEGSPAGRYSISIVNAAGETLVTTKAVSSNGIDLSVVLNLQKISPGSYLLRVTRAGEAAGYYPVTVKE